MDYSVIVTTYNFDYNKLFETLYSIIIQKNCTFEIIISDDGSREFNSKRIIDFFEKNNFTNYKILDNKINVGTVMNINKAIEIAVGKLVKLISPGDLLYEENVLEKAYNYMVKNNYSIIFGKAIYYSINDQKDITFYNMRNPLDLNPYINYNLKKIKKANLFYKDLILGAAFVSNKELFKRYLKKIIDIVKYNEDLSCILMLMDDIRIEYWDEYLIWYEYGTGISTSSDRGFEKKLYEDKKKFFYIFGQEYHELMKIYKIFYGKFQKFHIISKLRRKFKRKFSERKIKKLSECDINDNKIKLIKLLENTDVKGE